MSILCSVLCCAEKHWTLQEIFDVTTIVPPTHFRLLPPQQQHLRGCWPSSQGIRICQTNRNRAGCTEGTVWHYLTATCSNGSLWQGCCCCFPYTCSKAHKSEFKLGEGWVCSHCTTWPLGWFNHSTKWQPETADRKQMGPFSFHSPNTFC